MSALVRNIAAVIMAKAPQAGVTKTRLSPPLTAGEAAEFYRCMFMDMVYRLTRFSGVDWWVAYAPAGRKDLFRSLVPPSIKLMVQRGRNLGERMHNIFVERLKRGACGVLVLGSDLPTLPMEYLEEAVARLSSGGQDVLLGPTLDGGYYLVGMSSPDRRLFEDISWSTGEVLSQTVRKADEARKTVGFLKSWYDIDNPSDVGRLVAELKRAPFPDGDVENTKEFLKAWFRRG